MRRKGIFDFPNSGKILKNYCKYDYEKHNFKYISTEKYPNYLMRFQPKHHALN